ncbi:CCGSCS motif protein [Photobacterium indicum]|uniref:CCGSCS motif protein n=1 Tax=Photobacterium indicum TaxID=81447 RepID=A0A2T3L5K7_9GAMM|nr:CCGSCS motif protein [Photobacterium indicum]PSV45180.1 CCGSCS motif protein [Photobacterium indicum]
MGLSFKKIFKKDDSKAEQEKVGIEASSQATATNADATQEETKKKGKHGEPGFCCGSCS